jgi:elongation factor 1-beta
MYILDIQPWNEDTDVAHQEAVRAPGSVPADLGNSTLVPLDYGVPKTWVKCVEEADMVIIRLRKEVISESQEHVRNANITAFRNT